MLCQSSGRGSPRSSSTWARRAIGVELVGVEQRAEPSAERARLEVGDDAAHVVGGAAGSRSPAKSQMTVRSFQSSWNVRPWSMPTMTSFTWSWRQ